MTFRQFVMLRGSWALRRLIKCGALPAAPVFKELRSWALDMNLQTALANEADHLYDEWRMSDESGDVGRAAND